MPNIAPVMDPHDTTMQWAILDGTLMMRYNGEENRTGWMMPNMTDITPERVALWHRMLHPPEAPPALPLLYLNQAVLREGTKVTLWSHVAGKAVIAEVVLAAEGIDRWLSVPGEPNDVSFNGVTSRDGHYHILSIAGHRFPGDELGRVYQALSDAGFSTAHDAALLVQNLAGQRDTAVEQVADLTRQRDMAFAGEREVRNGALLAWKFAVDVRQALGGAATTDFDAVLGQLTARLADLAAHRSFSQAVCNQLGLPHDMPLINVLAKLRERITMVVTDRDKQRESMNVVRRFVMRLAALDPACDVPNVMTVEQEFTTLGDILTTWHGKAAHFDALRGALTALLDA